MYVIKARRLAKVERILFKYAVKVNSKDEIGYDYFEIPVRMIMKLIYELAGYKPK